MLETSIIFLLGLLPPLLSFFLIRRAEKQAQNRLRSALAAAERRQLQALRLPADHHYIDGVGYLIGDFTCRYNARSAHMRCAVNPSGPCQECPYYESITPTDPS
jgi:Family of unknown function (DUF6464)